MLTTPRFALWAPLLAMLAGCAGSVIFGHTIGERPNAAAPPATTSRPALAATTGPAVEPTVSTSVSSVDIVVAPGAQQKIAAEPDFAQSKLLAAVERELRGRRLLDAGGSGAQRILTISIDDFARRPSTNAVILGYSLGNGELAADLRVSGSDRREIRAFRIQAGSRLATRAGVGNEDPLGPLFHRFAVLTADALAGVPSKADDAAGNAMPR